MTLAPWGDKTQLYPQGSWQPIQDILNKRSPKEHIDTPTPLTQTPTPKFQHIDIGSQHALAFTLLFLIYCSNSECWDYYKEGHFVPVLWYQVHVDTHMLWKITVPVLEQEQQILCTHLEGQCAPHPSSLRFFENKYHVNCFLTALQCHDPPGLIPIITKEMSD